MTANEITGRNEEQDKIALLSLMIERLQGNYIDVQNRGYDCGFDEQFDEQEDALDDITTAVQSYTERLLDEMLEDLQGGGLELSYDEED